MEEGVNDRNNDKNGKNYKKKSTEYHEETSPVEIEERVNNRNDYKIE